MKVYISVDIEGVTGVTAWEETEVGCYGFDEARIQMSKEAAAACRGALKAGATEIFVKDAHETARNIDSSYLPEEAVLSRGWTNTPESMMAGIDESFDAAIFIGYHSGAGENENPLAHTMNRDNNYVKINGKRIAEFDLNAYVAAYYGVPVTFVSGDEALCEHAKALVPEIETTGVKYGVGNAAVSISPVKALKLIEEGVYKSLTENPKKCLFELPEKFELEINFKDAVRALRGSYYPGAEQVDEKTVKFTGNDVQEMMTARMFIL